jgi:hypothetical protein
MSQIKRFPCRPQIFGEVSVPLPANLQFSVLNEYFAVLHMEVTETIQCPFCGQSFEIAVDTSVAAQRFTTDCEVCCRPFEVIAECEPGEILSLDVQS